MAHRCFCIVLMSWLMSRSCSNHVGWWFTTWCRVAHGHNYDKSPFSRWSHLKSNEEPNGKRGRTKDTCEKFNWRLEDSFTLEWIDIIQWPSLEVTRLNGSYVTLLPFLLGMSNFACHHPSHIETHTWHLPPGRKLFDSLGVWGERKIWKLAISVAF